MKSLIAAVIALSCSMSGLAQTPSPSTPAQEITLNEQTRREVIEAALSAVKCSIIGSRCWRNSRKKIPGKN